MALALTGLATGGEGRAQSLLQSAGEGPVSNGWQILGASTSMGYFTFSMPNGGSIQGRGAAANRQSEFDGSASVSLGYLYAGPRNSFSLTYTPTLVQRLRYTDVHSVNQSLSVSFSRHLTPRWNLTLAGGVTDTTYDQMLFAPSLVTPAPTLGNTPPDLFQTGQQAGSVNSQIASSLAGNAYVVSPSRTLLFSTAYLNTTVSTGLEYHVSPRLRLFWNLGAGYNTMRGDTPSASQDRLASAGFLSQDGVMGMSLSVAPRTEMEVASRTSHIAASLGRYYLETVDVSLTHRFSPHWFGTVRAGPSLVVRTSRSLFSGLPAGTTTGYAASGSLGYARGGHAVTVSYSRAPSDQVGFGASGGAMATASWEWHPVAAPWWVSANGGRQSLGTGTSGDIQYWQGALHIGRALSRQFSTVLSLGYLGRPAVVTAAVGLQDLSGVSARISLLWTPRRPEPGSGLSTRPATGAENRTAAGNLP